MMLMFWRLKVNLGLLWCFLILDRVLFRATCSRLVSASKMVFGLGHYLNVLLSGVMVFFAWGT